MLAVLLSWILMFFVFFSFGNALSSLYFRILRKSVNLTFVDTSLLGMVFVGSIISIVSFLVPANCLLMGVLIGFSLIYWIINKRKLSSIGSVYVFLLHNYVLVLVLISVIAILAFCNIAPFWYDTLFYHHQNVMWNEQFSIVPGLANLQPRFGFNSNYFLLTSTFGLSPIFGQIIYGVHSLCLVLIIIWTMYKSSTSGSLLKGVLAILGLGLFIFLYKDHITSLSTDMLPNLLVLYIVLRFIFDRDVLRNSPLFIFAIATYCITLKISVFPLAILCLYIMYMYIKEREGKKLLFFITLGLFIAVPWFARNVVISGYLIFPFYAIDFFDVDWKVPLEYAKDQQDFIKLFAQNYLNAPTLADGLKRPLTEWIPYWWKHGEMNPLSAKMYVCAMIISFGLSVYTYIIYLGKRKYENAGLMILHLVLFLGLVAWFFNAPALRFMYGFVLGYIILSVYLFMDIVIDAKKMKLSKITGLCLTYGFVALLVIFSFRWVYYNSEWGLSWIKPQGMEASHRYMEKYYYPSEQKMIPFDVNGITIYKSNLGDSDIFTFDAPLPAGRDYVGGISMRGTTLQEGFRCLDGYSHRKTYIDNNGVE